MALDKCPRKGARVRFNPNPASAMLYSYRVPEKGALGTVTTIWLSGKDRTCLPGPGGGLVYVDWDAGFMVGISRYDLDRVSGGRKLAGVHGLGALASFVKGA